jgi:hypothetical protein
VTGRVGTYAGAGFPSRPLSEVATLGAFRRVGKRLEARVHSRRNEQLGPSHRLARLRALLGNSRQALHPPVPRQPARCQAGRAGLAALVRTILHSRDVGHRRIAILLGARGRVAQQSRAQATVRSTSFLAVCRQQQLGSRRAVRSVPLRSELDRIITASSRGRGQRRSRPIWPPQSHSPRAARSCSRASFSLAIK